MIEQTSVSKLHRNRLLLVNLRDFKFVLFVRLQVAMSVHATTNHRPFHHRPYTETHSNNKFNLLCF